MDDLVREVKAVFLGLETDAAMAKHKTMVLEFMQNEGAICAIDNGAIVGYCIQDGSASRSLCPGVPGVGAI